jgi:mono/diheme cytochrome c family protein
LARRGPWTDWERAGPTLRLGREVFDRECHLCHPGGEAGLGFSLNNKALPGALVKLQVRRGIGAMPAFSKAELSDEELDALVAYLAWLRRATPLPS